MPLPTVISDISPVVGTGAAPNAGQPGGGESPSTFDDYMRAYGAYIAQLRDGPGFTVAVRSNALGSVTVPAFSFVGDTDTGVFSPGANILAATTGGIERMRIDSSGNVGIGRVASGGLRLDVAGGGRVAELVLENAGSAGTLGTSPGLYSPASGQLAISTNSAERLRIDSSGNVGIGTASPSTRLHVGAVSPSNGVTAILGSTGSTGTQLQITQSGIQDWTIGQPAGVDAFAVWRARNTSAVGTEAMRIDASGNVGIGIGSPTVPCDVAGAIRTRAVTVAALPAAATAGAGSRHFVTDATATTFAAVVAGGGANGVPVYSDGTNWRIG